MEDGSELSHQRFRVLSQLKSAPSLSAADGYRLTEPKIPGSVPSHGSISAQLSRRLCGPSQPLDAPTVYNPALRPSKTVPSRSVTQHLPDNQTLHLCENLSLYTWLITKTHLQFNEKDKKEAETRDNVDGNKRDGVKESAKYE